MQLTSNYGLKKPEGTDIVDIADFNTNADIIDTQLKSLNTNKLDKVTGKQLSTNDYTTAEKNKLAGIAAGAQVNTVTSVAGRTGAVTLAKSDVDLGNVVDYGIATQAEAEVGTVTDKYMTVQRTKQAIDKNLAPLQTQVTEHLAQTSEIATFTKAVAQTIAHSSEQQIVFATQTGMSDKLKINAQGYIEAIVGGVYDVNFSAQLNGGGTGGVKTIIVNNNSQDITSSKTSVSSKVKRAAGAVFYIAVGNISGSSVDVITSVLTNVQITYLGE